MASQGLTESNNFLTECQTWINIIQSRYDTKISSSFKSELLSEWYDENEADGGKENFIFDLEVEEWHDSTFMDALHEQSGFSGNDDFCETFFKVLKRIVNGD